MKTSFLVVVVFSSIAYVNAQSNRRVEDGLFKINALLPGISYEFGVDDRTTINLDAVIGFALNGGSNRETSFGLYPGLGAELRNYVNFDRRIRKGKNISGNTGNYISFLNQFQLGKPVIGGLEYNSSYFYNVAAVYGLQRTYSKGFYFNLGFGPAVFFNEFDKTAGILIDARIGWVIGGRKN